MDRLKLEVTGLDHINLVIPVGGEAVARDFYTELLGLAEQPKPPSIRRTSGCWFRLGALALHLSTDEGFLPATQAHPAFLVRDLRAAARRLEAAGYGVAYDTQVPHVRRFFSSDPFGNRLEFIQVGDAF